MKSRLLTFLLTLTFCLGQGWIQPVRADDPVAKVVDIKGTMEFQRGGPLWSAAFMDMPAQVSDKLRTDQGSWGVVDFVLGGRFIVAKGSVMEIVGERKVKEVVLRKGTVWAKLAKQKEPLQVRTTGAVMGIKGTEFVVTASENGSTELSVLEGVVSVGPTAGGSFEAFDATAGMKVVIPDPNSVPITETKTPEELREEEEQRHQDFADARRGLYAFSGFAGASVYPAVMVVNFIEDPEQAAMDMARSEAVSRVPGGMGRFVPRGNSGGKKKPKFALKLKPNKDQRDVGSSPPSFSWDPYEDAQKYAIYVGRAWEDNKLQDITWAARTEGTSVAYPSNGAPLEAGDYHWVVIPLDNDDPTKPYPDVEGSHSVFTSAGWAPPMPEPEETPSDAPADEASP